MTPCQIVAFNLRRARLLHDWTQEQAAEALEPFLGVRWSKANYSAAERGVAGARVRGFTADELFAFARGFSLPISFFLITPPRPDVRVRHMSGAEEPAADFLGLALAADDHAIRMRLAEHEAS
jgi:transcriptional regulator with XRE-family HTH domain